MLPKVQSEIKTKQTQHLWLGDSSHLEVKKLMNFSASWYRGKKQVELSVWGTDQDQTSQCSFQWGYVHVTSFWPLGSEAKRYELPARTWKFTMTRTFSLPALVLQVLIPELTLTLTVEHLQHTINFSYKN